MILKIFKFGGMCLDGEERIKSALNICVSQIKSGVKLICVVSAMGKTTDEVFRLVRQINPDATLEETIGILGLGEILSGKIMQYSLQKAGVRSTLIEPYSKTWPIMLKKDGSINKALIRKRAKEILHSIRNNFECIVIPGFIALKENGSWGTLGRGGSDTTALILGKYLNADEVVIVKDVDGVYNADPKLLPNAKKIRFISADELSTISSFGAKVIHSSALKFKQEAQSLKIVHRSFGNLIYEGTVIDGKVSRKLFSLKTKLSLISLYKKNISSYKSFVNLLINDVMEVSKVYGITLGIDYLGFYIPMKNSGKVLKKINRLLEKKRLNIIKRDNIALLIMRRESPVNLPGMINYLLTPLARINLNIVEVITVGREILLFVGWDDKERAMNILKIETKEE